MRNKKVHKDLKVDAIQLTIQAHKSYKEHSATCSTVDQPPTQNKKCNPPPNF